MNDEVDYHGSLAAVWAGAHNMTNHTPCAECDHPEIPLVTFDTKDGERYWWCPKKCVFGQLNDKPLFWEGKADVDGAI